LGLEDRDCLAIRYGAKAEVGLALFEQSASDRVGRVRRGSACAEAQQRTREDEPESQARPLLLGNKECPHFR
jgi:hypothetical protein